MEKSTHTRCQSVRIVVGPDGAPLSVIDLPPAQNRGRWVTRRKAQVVAAVSGGLLSIKEACERYSITPEEFLSWYGSVARFGVSGLRATKLQQYRGR